MKKKVITSEIFIAYCQCPLKAYLLLFTAQKGKNNQYNQILVDKRQKNRLQYLKEFQKNNTNSCKLYNENLETQYNFQVNAVLNFNHWQADCDILTKVNSNVFLEPTYEPTIIVGTYKVNSQQKIELLFIGKVLGQIQNFLPRFGSVVGKDSKIHKVNLSNSYEKIEHSWRKIEKWSEAQPPQPPLILNKYCQTCQFRFLCREQAEKEDNLSLLTRITPQKIRAFNKKGIFTVRQLSHLFRPRKRRKKNSRGEKIKHKFELQALAITDQKTYIEELPNLPKKSVDIFMDFEGVPDQDFYYLMGILVSQQEEKNYFYFWADSLDKERNAWMGLLSKLNEYPESLIFHYTKYEITAINKLQKKYATNCDLILSRFVNLNTYIYGKIYFPSYSNQLKDIAACIVPSWKPMEFSGLESIGVRYMWEEKKEKKYKEALISYNKNDCELLLILKKELLEIKNKEGNIEFTSNIVAASISENSIGIKNDFQRIRDYSCTYRELHKNKLRIRWEDTKKDGNEEKIDKRKNRPSVSYHRIVPKPQKEIYVPCATNCPECGTSLRDINEISDKTVIDLIFTKNGVRKAVLRYWGETKYCEYCRRKCNPKGIKPQNQLFGHSFQAWVIYQRVFLRLSINNIVNLLEDQFNEKVSTSTITKITKTVANYYSETEDLILQRILQSPYVCVDETTISILGVNQYVWVFAAEKHILFKLTETRESTIVHEILSDYNGVLISDFYKGYDSVNCRQQKCWVHLLRNFNDDLHLYPFDNEFEMFISQVRNLLIPIFETIDRDGLNAKYFKKHKKRVEEFYKEKIDNAYYESDTTTRYQKRFRKYRNSLFTFLEYSGIPWHNNYAENALRHFTKQRDMSGHFFEAGALAYLRLLSVKQTCKFQGKSFLKFLLSGKMDVDAFPKKKEINNVKLIG